MQLIPLSSLEKVMPDETPISKGFRGFSMLKNERKAFQLFVSGLQSSTFQLKLKSGLPDVNIYTVEDIPAGYAVNKKTADDFIIENSAGCYPDLLVPAENTIHSKNGRRVLWIEIEPQKDLPPGRHTLSVTIDDGIQRACCTVAVQVIDCALPEQTLIYTDWLHTDCLMDEYGVAAFSERYWQITEAYFKTAAAHGMNCVLTPLFTPPLDTKFGKERPTVQLVDVYFDGKSYTFGFEKLIRWIQMARRCGISYFEMSHLFTQWGAKHAPKIIVCINGKYKKLFGWKTRARSKKYRRFLTAFAAALKQLLEEMGLKEHTLIHVSDEPSLKHRRTYGYAAKLVSSLFKGYKIIDALSDFSFYTLGLADTPIPANDHIAPFVGQVPELWTYYCCVQDHDYVSNRFFSMPPQRNRILGFQLYKYQAVGFLHWGLNFWYTQYSRRKINPFAVTDAGGAFPSGDSFVVYPNPNGTPLCSTRLKIFCDGLQDMRALQALEALAGRETALDLLEASAPEALTFSCYPHEAEWLLQTRERINQAIQAYLSPEESPHVSS